ncbi:hypothetical protein GCM10022254_40760 [Actinomadura meridiana]|uniref:DUF4304 domain-containing protein n=1 Tax=Actinomadura meridiana TaxID=559626 RepID=A0ABP8C7V5_9ACTN
MSTQHSGARSSPRDHLAGLEAHLAGRGFETYLHDKGLTVIAPTDPLGFRLTTMIQCRPRWDDGGKLWFLTDQGAPLAEAGRIIDTAVAVTALLRPLPGARS